MASTNLPLNNIGLVLLAVNGENVATPPTASISLVDVINVVPSVVNVRGSNVRALRINAIGQAALPNTYDFQATTETPATATAGFTVGAATNNDQARITVNGVNYTVTASGASTPATIKTAMDGLLTDNTQGFTFTSTNNAGVLLWNITAPANSGAAWNTLVVGVTFPTNVGPTFSAAVHTNFAGGVTTDATATAGVTVGSVTAGDKWIVAVNGVNYIYAVQGGDTAATIRTAMSAELTANAQGFTFSSSLIGGVIKYYLTAPAGTGSEWDGFVVNSTASPNVGPTFGTFVHTNFTAGQGVAEQLQAFITAQSLSSPLISYTSAVSFPQGNVSKGPSFMLNNAWINNATYDANTGQTTVQYTPPLTQAGGTYVVTGNQTA